MSKPPYNGFSGGQTLPRPRLSPPTPSGRYRINLVPDEFSSLTRFIFNQITLCIVKGFFPAPQTFRRRARGNARKIRFPRTETRLGRKKGEKKPPKPLDLAREKTATAATGRWNAFHLTIHPREMSIGFCAGRRIFCQGGAKLLYSVPQKKPSREGRRANCLLTSNSQTNSACSGR